MSGDFEACPVGSLERLKALGALERGRLLIAYRPLANTVFMAGDQGEHLELTVEVVRSLHSEFGEVLRQADARSNPMGAVA